MWRSIIFGKITALQNAKIFHSKLFEEELRRRSSDTVQACDPRYIMLAGNNDVEFLALLKQPNIHLSRQYRAMSSRLLLRVSGMYRNR